MSTLTLMGAGPEGAASSSGFAATATSLGASAIWLIDEPSGTNATDSSGNAHTGTYGTGITLGQTSLLPSGAGTCGLFDNSANAKMTTAFNPFTGNLTVAGWAKLTNFTGQVTLFGGSNNTLVPALVIQSGGGQPAWFSDLSAASVTWLAGDFPTASNVFWGFTWNNTTKVSELFVGDGVTLNSKGQKTSANSFNATPGNFVLGCFGTNAGWRGQMDASATFPSVLTSANLSSLMTVS